MPTTTEIKRTKIVHIDVIVHQSFKEFCIKHKIPLGESTEIALKKFMALNKKRSGGGLNNA